MFTRLSSPMRKEGGSALLLALATLVLLWLRRGAQFRSPQVWDEDGTLIVNEFIHDGFSAFLTPVHDYYVLVSKIVSWLALQVSFLEYPTVSTWLTAAATIGIVLAVAKAPTLLRGRWLCALLVLLVPTNPEVFAVPLYLFWWSSILLFLLCLWDPRQPLTGWRCLLLLLAGLSTPAVFLVLPVLWIRALLFRGSRSSEALVAGLGTIAAAVQLASVIAQQIVSGKFPLLSFVQNVVPKYFGYFVIGHWLPQPFALWSGGLLVVAVLALWLRRDAFNFRTGVLLYLLLGAIALASLRIDPADAHPDTIGPRYFFFPYILLFWILVQFAAEASTRGQRTFASLVIAAAVFNAMPVFSRSHIDLNWRGNVLSCLQFNQYRIPVQYDGTGMGVWYLPVTRETCAHLLAKDPFYTQPAAARTPLVPYRIGAGIEADKRVATLVKDEMHGADYARSSLPGLVVVGSFRRSDEDTGSATFRVRRGESILFRSGPRTSFQRLRVIGNEAKFTDTLPVSLEWVTLDFSNRQLPEEFTVQVSDEGTGYGEWSAFAVRAAAP